MKRNIFAIISTIFLVTTFFAAHSHGAERGFDVNDVTILFPLNEFNKTQAYPNITFKDILSADSFKNIDRKAKALSKMESRYPYERWRIIGLRYDPCFPKSAKTTTTCLEQIRLIAQPYRGGGFEDVAMHLLFQINESPKILNSDAISKLRYIKYLSSTETQGTPLMPHPGLAQEIQDHGGTPGPIGDAIIGLVKQFATEKNLKEVTFTDADFNNNGPWFFMGGSIRHGNWNVKPIPGLQKKAKLQTTDDAGFVTDNPPAKNIGIDNFVTFGDNYGVKEEYLEAELYKIHRTQNPIRANPRNTDCASCHLVSNHESVRKLEGKSSNYQYQSPIGITGYTTAEQLPIFSSGFNFSEVVRVLGYSVTQPVVAPMVANSSAQVAEQMNKSLNLPPPTDRDCRKQESQLRICLMANENIDQKINFKACFEKHCTIQNH